MEHNYRQRNKLKSFFILAILLAISITTVNAQPSLLNPLTQQKFVNPLPDPAVINATAGGTFNIYMSEFYQDLGLKDPATDASLLTKVWGYNGTYPGPTIEVRTNTPVSIFWHNNLTDSYNQPLPHLFPIDTSLHWALEGIMNWESLGVPTVAHLHGGHTESASDGLPDQWFTPGFAVKGSGFVKGDIDPYYYDNSQDAATIWYHDHALGITRLNVYAGLAGFYLIRDTNEDGLIAANNLPTGPYEREIVIQDRMFTSDGQLHYPVHNMEGVANSHIPEFFGDFIVVNGKTWPVLDVEPRQYRFRLLNGSDSRFYNLFFIDDFSNGKHEIGFNQIGTDLGLLESPVSLNQLLIAPGERADIVIDFSNPLLWGHTIIMKNNARGPYPKGDKPDMMTTGQIMAFRVNQQLNNLVALTSLPATLRPSIPQLVQNGPTRSLILFEGEDEYDRLIAMLGTTDIGALHWNHPITENPMLDDIEQWDIYNLTEDAHPVHLHLVAFQIISRRKFKATVDENTGIVSNIKLIGQPTPPPAKEKGWKDTAIMLPGEVTQIRAKFDKEGLYVWHCHILSHEDHEMMRPYYVGTMPNQMRVVTTNEKLDLQQNVPNPFAEITKINFNLPSSGNVNIILFDVTGREIKTILDKFHEKGLHSVELEGKNLHSGIYYYKLSSGNKSITKKLIIAH